jgi:hypothetical protein
MLCVAVFSVSDAGIRVANQLNYPIKFEYHWVWPLPLGNIKHWGTEYTLGPIDPGATVQSNIGALNLKSRYKIYVDVNKDGKFPLMFDESFFPGKAGNRHVTVFQSQDDKVAITDALW